ncbi:MAG: DUF4012 domain-containing protein [Candidatus Magasanikbacteria bacterium]|nr:DUF4012 domain-containing protein [Candidatus Magasanikbacteria bacterium]
MFAKKRIQLRRCNFCNKPGHNRTTCPKFLASQKTTLSENKLPLNEKKIRFFYHNQEQKNSDTVSPHLVNLKNQQSHWQNMETASPETEKSEWDKFYEEIKNRKQEEMPPAKIHFILPEKTTEEIKTPFIKTSRNLKSSEEKDDFLDFQTLVAEIEKEKKIKKTKTVIPKIKKQPKKPLFSTTSPLYQIKWRKALAGAMMAMIVLAIPLQTKTFYQNLKTSTRKIAFDSTEGFMALQNSTAAIMSADLPTAQDSITEALQKFNNAINEIQSHKILQTLANNLPIVRSEVQSRQNLITAGQKIALGNTYLIKGITEANDTTLTPLARLNTITIHLNSSIPNYEQAYEDLDSIKIEILPFEYQAIFKDFKLLFNGLLNDLKNISELSHGLNEIFGGKGTRSYLLVFQNEAEIRPTGGFLGSFAVIEIKDGKIIKLDIPAGGTYDLQGQLSVLVEPPTPILLSNKKWEFQDANWFPDFKNSAEKMLWFYRYSRNTTLDGVIAVNSSVLQRLVSLIGPVTDEKRNITLNEMNVLSSLQTTVEEGPEKKDNIPKQILSDLAPQFLSSIFNLGPENTLPMLFNLNEALNQKEIQAYFVAPSIQKTIESFGWAGRIAEVPNDRDYLMVINSNIQGQKSDLQIKQKIYHQSIIENDGSVINSVTITREHEGTEGQKFYGQTNIDYIRLYVPEGAELISATGFTWPDEKYFRAPAKGSTKDEDLITLEQEVGFEKNSGTRITKEFGKTAFGNWVITDPGTISTVQFIYRLPFKVFSPENMEVESNIFNKFLIGNKNTSQYQLLVQRQSGCRSTFESQVIYPSGWESTWSDGENSNLALNGYFVSESPLKNDKIWSLIMEKNN